MFLKVSVFTTPVHQDNMKSALKMLVFLRLVYRAWWTCTQHKTSNLLAHFIPLGRASAYNLTKQ